MTVVVLEPAWRADNINTYQYGVRDGVWDGVARDQIGIAVRFGNVVRFEFGGSGDSRVGNGIGIRDASSVGDESPKLYDHKLSLSHRVELQDRLMTRRV